jgi:hypothetical protein
VNLSDGCVLRDRDARCLRKRAAASGFDAGGPPVRRAGLAIFLMLRERRNEARAYCLPFLLELRDGWPLEALTQDAGQICLRTSFGSRRRSPPINRAATFRRANSGDSSDHPS